MKITVINGSARKGNCYAAVNAFAEGAGANNEIDIINADGLNISPCKGCGACECYKGCVAQDDSNAIVDRIVSADMIVFASPVYWWGISAQLKTVIDKCYCKGAYLKGKKIGLIVCGGAPTDDEEFELIKKQFDCMAEYLGWEMKFFKPVFAVERTALAGNREILDELKKLGAEM